MNKEELLQQLVTQRLIAEVALATHKFLLR
jgi:hypothetical protein